MTIDRFKIRRESVSDWPLFQGLSLPEDMGVLSVEVSVNYPETTEQLVAKASAGLRPIFSDEEQRACLLLASGPLERSDRLVVLKAAKGKVWGWLRAADVMLPAGPRQETEVPLSGTAFVLAGWIGIDPDGLPLALGATRVMNGVCVTTHVSVDPLSMLREDFQREFEGGTPRLIKDSMRLHGKWTYLARAFGTHGDRVVGVEVFGRKAVLESLEPAVAAEVNRLNSDHG
jgi:hypothetical protein